MSWFNRSSENKSEIRKKIEKVEKAQNANILLETEDEGFVTISKLSDIFKDEEEEIDGSSDTSTDLSG